MTPADHSIFYMNTNNGEAWLCIGVKQELVIYNDVDWTAVDVFLDEHEKSFVVTLLGYDLKNSIEKLQSTNTDFLKTPDLALIVPTTVYHIQDNVADLIEGPSRTDILVSLLDDNLEASTLEVQLKPSLTKEQYLNKLSTVKQHIQQGDVYELNFCQRFDAQHVKPFNYLDVYKKINNETTAPFSVYVDWKQWKMMGASPERYIKRVGHLLVSQPIKGTRKRGKTEQEDTELKEELRSNMKERAENVMIVDLVRNDLAKIALPGTVKVDELFGIYTFESVHQMISTISGTLKHGIKFSDIIKASFPMGSMTGAPKIRAMELIDEIEDFKRGWYSGSVGLIQPKGNFDLNVVIRSLIYNEQERYLCCPVGGAITDLSDPESEYEECLIKIERVLAGLHA